MRAYFVALVAVGGLVAGGCSTDVCAGVAGTCVALHVTAPNNAALTVDQLELAGTGAFMTPPHRTPSTPERQTLPIDVGVTFPAKLSGMETIHVLAYLQGHVVAAGNLAVSVAAGKHTQSTLPLASGPGAGPGADLSMGGGDLAGIDAGQADLYGVAVATITSPSSTFYARGTVNVQLLLTGPSPDSVELLVDGKVLAQLPAGTLQYSWDTSSVPEGSHMLVARTSLHGMTYDSPAVTVVVDRTAPTVASRAPAPTATNVEMLAPVTVTFSEPIMQSTITDGSVAIQAGSTQLVKTLSLSSDGMTLTITPTWTALTAATTTVTVTVTTQLTDLAGNALSVPAGAWTWTVPFWQTLTNLATSGGTHRLRLFADSKAQNITLQELATPTNTAFLHLYQLSGTTWNGLATTTTAPGGQQFGGATIAPNGTLMFAFGDNSTQSDPVWSWVNGAWQSGIKYVGTSNAHGAFPFTVDGTNAPIMADTGSSSTSTTVYRYSGGGWNAMGVAIAAAAPPNYADGWPARIDNSGVPILVMSGPSAGGSEVDFYRWSGTAFVKISGANVCGAANTTASSYGLTLEYGTGGIGVITGTVSGTPWCAGIVSGNSVTVDGNGEGPSTGIGLSGAPSNSGELLRVMVDTVSTDPNPGITVWRRHDMSDNAWHALAVPVTTATTVSGFVGIVTDASNRPIVGFTSSATPSTILTVRGNMPLP
jgi:hypothetical protein